MALYEIKTFDRHHSVFWGISSWQSFVETIKADTDEEVIAYVENNAVPGMSYEITKITKDVVATLSASDIATKRKALKENAEKERRRKLYNELKAEFEQPTK